jgi:hypothetical protein
MIWLTWRQHRAVLAVCVGLAVALAAWMLFVQHNYVGATHAIAKSCASQNFLPGSRCAALSSTQFSAWEQGDVIGWILLAFPLLFGMFIGAPLFAGEFERRTVLFSFSQGVSRTRWTVLRWLFLGLIVLALTSALAVLGNWWFEQVPTNGSTLVSRMQPDGFDVTGVVPVAYSLFSFALGAALGTGLRRTVPTIFGTIVLFATTRILFEHYVRRNLVTPVFVPAKVSTSSIFYGALPSTAWDSGQGYRVLAGRHSAQLGSFIQPSSHYWALQFGEGGCFLAAAVMLFGLAIFWVRRWQA